MSMRRANDYCRFRSSRSDIAMKRGKRGYKNEMESLHRLNLGEFRIASGASVDSLYVVESLKSNKRRSGLIPHSQHVNGRCTMIELQRDFFPFEHTSRTSRQSAIAVEGGEAQRKEWTFLPRRSRYCALIRKSRRLWKSERWTLRSPRDATPL